MSEDTEEPYRVLVVDGDAFVRPWISDELRDRGFEVREADSGTDALSILSSGIHFDAIFADTDMCKSINGFTLAQLAAERFGLHAVVLTSSQSKAKERAEGQGIPFITKHYRADAVAAALDAVLADRLRRKPNGAVNGVRDPEA